MKIVFTCPCRKVARRKGGCIRHASVSNFWQIGLVNSDEELYKVAACWDLLPKVATGTDRAAGGTQATAVQSPVPQLKWFISVGPRSVGMVYTALCPGQPFTRSEPLPLLPTWLLHSPTWWYWIAKQENAPHLIWCHVEWVKQPVEAVDLQRKGVPAE